MTGEEIGREKKAKALARMFLRETVRVVSELKDNEWFDQAEKEGFRQPSPETRARVIEILSEIAI